MVFFTCNSQISAYLSGILCIENGNDHLMDFTITAGIFKGQVHPVNSVVVPVRYVGELTTGIDGFDAAVVGTKQLGQFHNRLASGGGERCGDVPLGCTCFEIQESVLPFIEDLV